MNYYVQVRQRTVLPTGKVGFSDRRDLNFEFDLPITAPGKAQRKAREDFNARKVKAGKGVMVCVSTGCNDGLITLVCDSSAAIEIREEETRLAMGGVPARSVPVSRHSRG